MFITVRLTCSCQNPEVTTSDSSSFRLISATVKLLWPAVLVIEGCTHSALAMGRRRLMRVYLYSIDRGLQRTAAPYRHSGFK